MRFVNMTAWFDEHTLDQLTVPEPRLPGLEKLLLEEVWTKARFQANDMVPSQYLKSGETMVNGMECMLTATADSYFDELCALPVPSRTVADFFAHYKEGCVLVLDGCSLREMPRLMELAGISRRPVIESLCSRSAIPSTTERFVGERLGLGLPMTAPSRLTSRRELREKNIRFYFFHRPNEHQTISDDAGHVLMWHSFPDRRFMDSTASTAEFFDGIWDTLEIVWKKTVQALPPSRHVLVTSDHGYVYLGPGLSDRSLDGKDRALNGKRSREFTEEELLPAETPELFVDRERRLAAIRGRCHNRPQAPSPAQSVYRHEGISLMEVLTPWLILGPMEV
jgi:hypothetical protein